MLIAIYYLKELLCLPIKGEAARLEEQIILADTQVCLALLTFLQQDVSGCMRGGWLLRKAWRVYNHTYDQILALYRQTFGPHQPVPGICFIILYILYLIQVDTKLLLSVVGLKICKYLKL